MKAKKNAVHATTRDRLLESARTIFSRKGYAASIREIAEASGTTLPSIYYYFGSKEGLFQELMRSRFEKILSQVHNVDDDNGSAREKIKKSMLFIYLSGVEDVEYVRLMLLISHGPPQGAPAFDVEPYYHQFHELVVTHIKRGIKKGEFRRSNADDMAWVVRGAMEVAMEDLCRGPVRNFDQKKLERILDVILDGFSAGKPN